TRDRASSPLAAVATRYPSDESDRPSISCTAGTSSTTRIDPIMTRPLDGAPERGRPTIASFGRRRQGERLHGAVLQAKQASGRRVEVRGGAGAPPAGPAAGGGGRGPGAAGGARYAAEGGPGEPLAPSSPHLPGRGTGRAAPGGGSGIPPPRMLSRSRQRSRDM